MPELPPPPTPAPAPWSALVARLPWVAPAASAGGAVLAVAIVTVLAWTAWRGTDSGSAPELTIPRAAAPADAGDGASSGVPGIVIVHVAGAVGRPGVYRLAATARVADALDAAGGPSTEAEVDGLNLAAKVADGDRIYVPRHGEAPPVAATGTGPLAGPLDLNTATAAQLDELPGVGPATAEAIVAYRTEHGRFRTVEELLEVRGIGEAKLASLRAKVRVR